MKKALKHLRYIKSARLGARIAKGFVKGLVLKQPVLRSVELAINYECNAKCEMCYARDLLDAKRANMTVEQIKSIWDQAHELGAVHVNLSVDGDTKVFAITNGLPIYNKIKNIIDPYFDDKEDYQEKAVNNLLVPCFDKKGNIIISKVSKVIRHVCKDELYKIKTEYGKEIICTGSHSIFTFNDKKIMPIKVADLKTNTAIITPKCLDNYNSYPLIDSIKVTDYLNIKLIKSKDKLRRWNEINTFPEIISGCPFFWLLGIYLAEGHLRNRTQIIFSFGSNALEQMLINKTYTILESLGLRPYIRKVNSGQMVECSNPILSNFLLNTCGKDSYSKKIPSFMFSLDENKKYAFLEALHLGDGYSRKRKEGIQVNVVKTISKELAEDTHALLMTLGINSALSEEKPTIKSYEHILPQGHKPLKLNNIYCVNIHNKRDALKILSNVYDKNNITDFIKNQFMESYDTKIQRGISKDLALIKVKQIEKLPSNNRYVYDFSVPKYENFIGGFGSICLHNTGGEPLLRKDICEIVKVLKPKSTLISIVTNASLIDEEKIKALKKAGLSYLQISLDSVDAKKHDDMRKIPGLYEKTIRAVELCKKYGISCCFSSVVYHGGVEDFEKIVKLAKKYDIMVLMNYVGIVGGWKTEEELALTKDDFVRIHNLMKDPNVRFHTMYNFSGKLECPAGKEKLYITAYGDVMPCNKNQMKAYGNVLKEPLKDIWMRMYYNPEFTSYCKDCKRFNL